MRGKYEREVFGGRKSVSVKSAAILLTLVLVLSIVIGGTMAWLMDETDPVTNTFTVGDINITLKETTGENYKIVPGGFSEKNPKVTVLAGSEKCYVYVLVENTVMLDGEIVATPNVDAEEWGEVASGGNKTLYRYIGTLSDNGVVDALSAEVEIPVFGKVTYADTITKDDIDTLKNTTIKITAFAHQSANTDVDTADANIKAKAELT